jgi:hypothetical protein
LPICPLGLPYVLEHLEFPFIVIVALLAPHGPIAVHVPSYKLVLPVQVLPLVGIFETMGQVKTALHNIGAAGESDVAVTIKPNIIIEICFPIFFTIFLFGIFPSLF